MSQSSSLLIKTKICSNDNFELLDYNSLDIIMNKNNIDKSGMLLRSENKVYFNENSDNVKDNETELLKIIKDTQNDCYYINTEDYKKDSNEILEKKGTFLVYRNSYIDEDKDEEKDNCKRFYKLSEGDIIKIGRVFIRILTINLDNKDTTEKTKNINSLSISKKMILILLR
jgi:hypothetical protein